MATPATCDPVARRTPRPRDLLTAVAFLTRVPLGAGRPRAGNLERAAAFFPLVGLVVASVGLAVRAGTGWLLGPVPATVLAVTAMVAMTGAFHEDGLADTVDGLWGGQTPERRLEILRDSRLGTYGTAALVLVLLLRVVLLAPLSLAHFASAVIVAHVVGQAAGLALAWALPPARRQGLGWDVAGRPHTAALALAVTTVAVVSALTLRLWAPAALAAAVLGAALVAVAARRRLGGVTGDVCGAANQIAHVLVLAVVLALTRHGAL